MNLKKINKKKGVAGLDVFLSVITFLFLIGLIVMIFVIAGGRLETTAQITASLTGTEDDYNSSLTGLNVTLATCSAARNGVVTAITNVSLSNGSLLVTGSTSINTGNYSVSGCIFSVFTGRGNIYNTSGWNISYNYNYATNPEALDVINVTKTSLGSVTDWFDIFVVLGALVVLILLVVIIISAVRSQGLLGGGSDRPKTGP